MNSYLINLLGANFRDGVPRFIFNFVTKMAIHFTATRAGYRNRIQFIIKWTFLHSLLNFTSFETREFRQNDCNLRYGFNFHRHIFVEMQLFWELWKFETSSVGKQLCRPLDTVGTNDIYKSEFIHKTLLVILQIS